MSDNIIKLNAEYILCMDSNNIWIKKIKHGKNEKRGGLGQVRYETYCGYHKTFKELLNSFQEHLIRDLCAEAPFKNKTYFLNRIKKTEDHFKDVCDKISEELDTAYPKEVRKCVKRKI